MIPGNFKALEGTPYDVAEQMNALRGRILLDTNGAPAFARHAVNPETGEIVMFVLLRASADDDG